MAVKCLRLQTGATRYDGGSMIPEKQTHNRTAGQWTKARRKRMKVWCSTYPRESSCNQGAAGDRVAGVTADEK